MQPRSSKNLIAGKCVKYTETYLFAGYGDKSIKSGEEWG